ncbi:MAG TPA: GNAT family N-acetyltransferase [Alphaproteobacteria bacterium]|jgi:GNAT superfamily N-acetyltransferase
MDGGNTVISQATEDDGATLYALIVAMGFTKEQDYFERCLDDQAAGGRTILLARHGGQAAGYAMLNWKPPYALYKRLGIPEIQDLNVVPEMRRCGVATALIRHCEDLARGKGLSDIGISVGLDSGYGAAQRLYVKLGYIPDGHGVTYDRQAVKWGEIRPIDDDLCLMLLKKMVISE